MSNYTVNEHESYGAIAISRTHSAGRNLFGSNVGHSNTIRIRLYHATLERDINTDWIHPKGLISEIEVSNTQFMEMMTSINQGDGTPCTIKYLNGKFIDDPPRNDKTDLHREEFEKHQNKILEQIQNTIDITENLFSKKSLTKADKEFILGNLDNLRTNIGPNTDYQMRAFDEHMDKTVNEAKSEIEAFIQHKLTALGTDALREHGDILRSDASQIIAIDEKIQKEKID